MPLTHWRIAALFFIHALSVGAVQTRIPDLQLLNGLSEAQLGLVLMGQPLGGLPMFLVSSAIIERFGPRRVILWFLPVVVVTSALAGILLHPVALFALLALNGVGFSLTNIAINVEADRVEATSGDRIMNTCHGIWSMGFLATALLGVAMRGAGISPALHLGLLAPLLIAALLLIALPMPTSTARPHAGGPVRRLALPTLATLALVAFGLGAGLTEGASRAWAIIYLRDSFSVPAWIQSLALPALVAAMAVCRLGADRVLDRFGPVPTARVLAAIAIAGLALVVVAPNAGLGLFAFVMIGVGICVLYPLMLSAAARLGDRPASQNVAAVTMVFQLVNLGAPALIGVVAQGLGVRMAFAMLIPLLVLTFVMAGRLRPTQQPPG
ncbi:Fucose permease [Devosia lucknowensis]|uniref:Fucose permease n=1 Tax=Devosia lucknowensis TaxID=1096929 RepID=A0A1Y6G668_9HYPH|nr:MFS transporter [Devosia lucknowensis]SMQ85652.1 Fucose permease [Devosia lucknowensis]